MVDAYLFLFLLQAWRPYNQRWEILTTHMLKCRIFLNRVVGFSFQPCLYKCKCNAMITSINKIMKIKCLHLVMQWYSDIRVDICLGQVFFFLFVGGPYEFINGNMLLCSRFLLSLVQESWMLLFSFCSSLRSNLFLWPAWIFSLYFILFGWFWGMVIFRYVFHVQSHIVQSQSLISPHKPRSILYIYY